MTISPWTLYWINRLDTLDHILIGLTFICFAVCFITILVVNEPGRNYEPRMKIPVKTFSIFLPLAAILILVNCFLPSTKEMYAIYTIPKVINHPKVQETIQAIPDITADTMKLTQRWLKDKLNAPIPEEPKK